MLSYEERVLLLKNRNSLNKWRNSYNSSDVRFYDLGLKILNIVKEKPLSGNAIIGELFSLGIKDEGFIIKSLDEFKTKNYLTFSDGKYYPTEEGLSLLGTQEVTSEKDLMEVSSSNTKDMGVLEEEANKVLDNEGKSFKSSDLVLDLLGEEASSLYDHRLREGMTEEESLRSLLDENEIASNGLRRTLIKLLLSAPTEETASDVEGYYPVVVYKDKYLAVSDYLSYKFSDEEVKDFNFRIDIGEDTVSFIFDDIFEAQVAHYLIKEDLDESVLLNKSFISSEGERLILNVSYAVPFKEGFVSGILSDDTTFGITLDKGNKSLISSEGSYDVNINIGSEGTDFLVFPDASSYVSLLNSKIKDHCML